MTRPAPKATVPREGKTFVVRRLGTGYGMRNVWWDAKHFERIFGFKLSPGESARVRLVRVGKKK